MGLVFNINKNSNENHISRYNDQRQTTSETISKQTCDHNRKLTKENKNFLKLLEKNYNFRVIENGSTRSI